MSRKMMDGDQELEQYFEPDRLGGNFGEPLTNLHRFHPAVGTV
jgi:hypothetical protein